MSFYYLAYPAAEGELVHPVLIFFSGNHWRIKPLVFIWKIRYYRFFLDLSNNMMFPPQIFPNLSFICNGYKGILLDAYGVFWGGNGIGPLPGTVEAMENLTLQGKIVGILSNTTQLAAPEIQKLEKHGITLGKHFHFFISGGEIAKSLFMDVKLPFKTPNRKFWVLGAHHPRFASSLSLFQGTPFQETHCLHEADFIYIGIPHLDGQDQTDPEIFNGLLQKLKGSALPMVCANPDRFAHEGNPPQQVVRQGTLAMLYEAMGGEVFYIGKPYRLAYAQAMVDFSRHSISKPDQIIMVGDTPETDIRGASQFGMPSALVVKTGMMADRISAQGWEKCFQELSIYDMPNFFIERLA